MSTAPEKTPNEDKKSSFWERLSQKKADEKSGGGSLVDAIVRQAEKEAGSKKSDESVKKMPNSAIFAENKEKNKARASLGNARTILGFVIFLAIGSWLYFFTMLDDSNYFHEKFGLENLTTEANRKVELSIKVSTDIRDTKKFGNLLKVENLADRVLAMDLDDLILNYSAPVGERVVSRSSEEKASEIFVKTTDDVGKIIYVSEAEIKTFEDARGIKTDFTMASIEEILELADELKNENITDANLRENIDKLLAELAKIDLDSEIAKEKFPSSVLKSHFAIAQSSAKNILKEVKNSNLKNLVTDIKNQIQIIDIIGADEPTQKAIVELRAILAKLHPDRPSTFENALAQIETAGIGDISDNSIYRQVIRIVGDPRSTEKNTSDLQTATMIAQNIGRVNIVNILESDRIVWSTVIERTQKIARLGADLARDLDEIPTNESRDLDPDGELVSLFSYSGESDKSQIEIQGEVAAEQNYEQKAFTLVADLIDALEASKYFYDVDGFSFSKEMDRDESITSPFNLSLTLQDPAIVEERDLAEVVIARPTTADDGDSDLENIDLSFDENENVENENAATETEN